MVSPVIVGIAITLFVYWIYSFINVRTKNFPPGPPRIPFLGNYLSLLLENYNHFHIALEKWCYTYKSKVVALFVGDYPLIVTGDPDLVKEILTRPEYDSRPFPYAVQIRSWAKRIGVFFARGNYWLEQRRFTLRYMRDYGFGRRMAKLEDVMENQLKLMFDLIENGPEVEKDKEFVRSGRLILAPDIFNPAFVNAFVTVLIGAPLKWEQRHYIQETSKGGNLFQQSVDSTSRLISILPWLRFIVPNFSGYNGIMKGHEKLLNFIKVLIQQRKELDPEKSEGFLDFYLKEMKARQALDERTSFTDEQLLLAGADFLLPSASAVGQQLAFFIQRILRNPQVGEKIFEEIKTVVGVDRLPTLDDRVNLPYCEATLRESLRIDTITALGVPRQVIEDTKLDGYSLPKDTIVLVNMSQMHMDRELWGDPEIFRPERFLDEEGRFCLKKDKSLPFGAGRRVCAGETFARNTMFIYIIGLLQKYKLEVAPGESLIDLEKMKNYSLITLCKPFWVKCNPR